MEKIISLSPDLVIVWASAAKGNIVEQLTALNVMVYVDEPQTLGDIARSLRDFGTLTGRVKQSKIAADNYLSRVQYLRDQYQHQRGNNINVLYEVWNSPLQTINGKHIISDVIDLCGGENVFADASLLSPKINIETVIDRDPDIIISSNMITSRQKWLDYWLQWPSLTAVRHRHLYFVDPDLIQRHTVRILMGAEIICQKIGKKLLLEGKNKMAE